MALDLTKITTITFQQLVDDAVASGDIARLRFLEDLSNSTAPRKNKKTGTTTEAPMSLMAIRSKYLQEYHGYVPKTKTAGGSRSSVLEEAFAKMKKK